MIPSNIEQGISNFEEKGKSNNSNNCHAEVNIKTSFLLKIK